MAIRETGNVSPLPNADRQNHLPVFKAKYQSIGGAPADVAKHYDGAGADALSNIAGMLPQTSKSNMYVPEASSETKALKQAILSSP